MKKLASKSGESIAETLIAVLILSLAFLILTGAVATAAKINGEFKNGSVAVGPAASSTPNGGTVTFTLGEGAGAVTDSAKVTVHQTSGHGYVYYDQPIFTP